MKKFYVSLLLFLLGTSSLFAAETINGITYNLDATARTAAVTTGTYSGAIVIPEKVTHNNREYTVTGIDASAFSGKSISSVAIPATVMSIGSNAFYQCTSLNSVTIAEGCEVINTFAFFGCSALAKIAIPASVKRIEEQAFANCSMLAEVTLNEGLTYIGAWAFGALPKLKKITIPSTVEDMGYQSFYNCQSLATIVWNAKHCSDFSSVLTAPFSIYNYGYIHMGYFNYTVYSSTYSGGQYNAYDGKINNPYYTYGHSCYNANPERNIAINNWTTSITFGDEVEHIPAYLCYQFQGELRNLVIPDNVKTIGDYAFYNNNRLVSLKLGVGLTEIGKYTFSGCSSLTEVSIPDNVTTINQYAFSGCTSLATLNLGKGIQTLGTYAFGNGGNLSTINIYAVNPPYIDNTVFTFYSDLMVIDLNVRERALDAYENANIWKNMHLGLVANDTRVFSLTVTSADNTKGTTTPSGSYDEDDEVVISALPKAGYQFDHWNDGSKDNPRTVKVTADLTYTAYFAAAAPTYTITATANALEGTAVGGGAFEPGAQATLAAVANAGYHFTQWADGNTSNPRQVTVAADGVYTAQFEKDAVIQRYTLTASSTNAAQGAAYGQGTYEAGTQIAVFAVANDGYHFTQWHDGNTDNPRMVTVAGDLALTAQFAAVIPVVKYTLTATANPLEGVAVGGGAYESGAQVTLAAVANAGYHFTQWADGNTSNPRQVTATADGVYTAQFEKDAVIQRYTLTTSTTNAAQGTAYGQGTYEAGTQIAVFAVANDGYHFTQWHDGNTDNPRMVTVAADAMYFANFAQDPVAPTLYELSVSSESPTKGWTTEGCAYELGAQVMIYAHPAAGFEFSQWSDGNTDNPRFITMTGEVNLTAQFVVKTTTNVSSANVSAAPAHKILRNGQVYIERNGKIYTVTGAEVK